MPMVLGNTPACHYRQTDKAQKCAKQNKTKKTKQIHTMKLNTKKIAKGFTLVELLVVIAIIAALAALATPVVLKQQKKAAATEAVNNAKQMFILLFEFDQDNGRYPGDATTMSTGALAASSNEAFREFIINSAIDTEELFYCANGLAVPPDGDLGAAPTYANAMVANECGFHYLLKNATTAHSVNSPSGVPLVITPGDALAPTGASPFAINPFGGRGVILYNDGSCKSQPITAVGTAGLGTVGTGATNPLDATFPPNVVAGGAPVVLPTL